VVSKFGEGYMKEVVSEEVGLKVIIQIYKKGRVLFGRGKRADI
jgi:hypothetical protein